MRNQTGGVMTMGSGGICGISTKQKLKARSSKQSELLGLHDVLPQILWTRIPDFSLAIMMIDLLME